MFLHVARRMEQAKDELGEADRATGDGDHGVAIARGFDAVRQRLEGQTFETVDELLRAIGDGLLSAMGGASGVLLAAFFTGGGSRLAGGVTFDVEAVRRLLVDGLDAVQKRGKAKPGDKTMVDALAPASQAASELPSSSLTSLLAAASEAARLGAEQTKTMVARVGKAKSLGQRSLGRPDPGALSICLLLEAMAEYVAERARTLP